MHPMSASAGFHFRGREISRGSNQERPTDSRGSSFVATPWLRAVVMFAALLAPTGLASAGTPLKIACVGDSITEGSGLSNPGTESWPAKLQRLFGTNQVVRNFGVSGRTLLKKGDFPYWKESFYTQSRTYAPNIVIIKLGTNDSKPYNWKYGTNFVSDYEEFIASYRTLPSQPRVILCTPVPVFGKGAYDIQPGTVATNIAPAVRDLGARLGLEVIDLHTRFANGALWFPDTVHPNSKGTSVMAAVIFDALGLAEPGPVPAVPELQLTTLTNRRVRLEWPAELGAMVLEAVSAYTATGAVRSILETPAYADSGRLRVTNTITGGNRFYRLWRP